MTTTLIDLLKDLAIASKLNEKQWETIIVAAREQKLLGRLYYLLKHSGYVESIPARVSNHLSSAFKVSKQQRLNVKREIQEICTAFERKEVTPILLKGAAYSQLNLACSFGRSFNDIDLLVPFEYIKQSEVALMVRGWIHKKEDEYNKEYYEKWMHEIQPMIHMSRLTVIDLHHNVLPRTNRFHFDSSLLKTVTSKELNIATLEPKDLFIHCAIHLFTEGELFHPLRDITDLSMLLDSIDEQNTISTIEDRAKELGVSEYVDWALYFCQPFCQRKHSIENIKARLNQRLINKLLILPAYSKIFSSSFVSNSSFVYKLSTFIIYIRGHLHRMPLKILIPHLIKKSFMKKDNKQTFGKDWG